MAFGHDFFSNRNGQKADLSSFENWAESELMMESFHCMGMIP
jgi:hypothetical protein